MAEREFDGNHADNLVTSVQAYRDMCENNRRVSDLALSKWLSETLSSECLALMLVRLEGGISKTIHEAWYDHDNEGFLDGHNQSFLNGKHLEKGAKNSALQEVDRKVNKLKIDLDDMKRAMKEQHEQMAMAFNGGGAVCPICEKKCKSQSALSTHLLTHT